MTLEELVREVARGVVNPKWIIRHTSFDCAPALAELAKAVSVLNVLTKIVSHLTNYRWHVNELVNYIEELREMWPEELEREVEGVGEGPHTLINMLKDVGVLSIRKEEEEVG